MYVFDEMPCQCASFKLEMQSTIRGKEHSMPKGEVVSAGKSVTHKSLPHLLTLFCLFVEE